MIGKCDACGVTLNPSNSVMGGHVPGNCAQILLAQRDEARRILAAAEKVVQASRGFFLAYDKDEDSDDSFSLQAIVDGDRATHAAIAAYDAAKAGSR